MECVCERVEGGKGGRSIICLPLERQTVAVLSLLLEKRGWSGRRCVCERKGIGEGKGGWGKMGEAFILLSREARGGHVLSYLERQWGAIISLFPSPLLSF